MKQCTSNAICKNSPFRQENWKTSISSMQKQTIQIDNSFNHFAESQLMMRVCEYQEVPLHQYPITLPALLLHTHPRRDSGLGGVRFARYYIWHYYRYIYIVGLGCNVRCNGIIYFYVYHTCIVPPSPDNQVIELLTGVIQFVFLTQIFIIKATYKNSIHFLSAYYRNKYCMPIRVDRLSYLVNVSQPGFTQRNYGLPHQ